ncbi:MAG: TadE/TadG family type IV pilus assembly protein [Candidatus Dormibacteria bacterium]
MIEFALAVPLLMYILLGLTDFARAVFYYNVIAQSAREGAREAILAYNQCSNQAPGVAPCASPPSGTSVVGVFPAINRATGGIMTFALMTGTNDGKTPDCNPSAASNAPPANQGCVWVFEAATGGTCTSPPSTLSIPNTGPNPSNPGGKFGDTYTLCDLTASKSSGHHNVVVEIEYRFQPLTPLIGGLVANQGLLWAKSEMRTEY